MTDNSSFEEYLASLAPFIPPGAGAEPDALALCERATAIVVAAAPIDRAKLAVAVKGFDSTGSKLSDAYREIEQMVEVKTPRQFIFAVVDGQGWIRRRGDLRRIHEFWASQKIDGLYTRSQLPSFESAIRDAAKRLALL